MMEVFLFGELADLAGTSILKLGLHHNTEDLLIELAQRIPGLDSLSFLLSVNQEVVTGNRTLSSKDEIALLPPFSGG